MLGKGILGCGTIAAAQRLLCQQTAGGRALRPRVIPRGQQLSSNPRADEISVITYNVLCARFATQQRLPHVAPPYLEYDDHRWPLLARELQEFGSDLVLLQEVTTDRLMSACVDQPKCCAPLSRQCCVQRP